jgi:peroxiredoxin
MNSKGKLLISLLIAIILLSGYILAGKDKISNNKFQGSSLVGKTAPDFTLKDLKGKKVKLSSLKGKVIILDFWATWCPPCRMEIPSFIELQTQYKKKGLIVLGVALDDLEKVKKFAKDNGINYPLVIGDEKVQRLYGGISAIPTTFVIGKDLIIKKQYVGANGKDVFEKDILELF